MILSSFSLYSKQKSYLTHFPDVQINFLYWVNFRCIFSDFGMGASLYFLFWVHFRCIFCFEYIENELNMKFCFEYIENELNIIFLLKFGIFFRIPKINHEIQEFLSTSIFRSHKNKCWNSAIFRIIKNNNFFYPCYFANSIIFVRSYKKNWRAPNPA